MKLVCHRMGLIETVENLDDADRLIEKLKLPEMYGLYIYEQEFYDEEVDEESEEDDEELDDEYEYDNDEPVIVYEEIEEDINLAKLKYVRLNGEWLPIKYKEDDDLTMFDYPKIKNREYRVIYHKILQYADKTPLILRDCKREDKESLIENMPGYDKSKSVRDNCEMFGRRYDNMILYDDSHERFVRRCGYNDPVSKAFWESIPNNRIIMYDEIPGTYFDGCRDIISLMNFFTEKFLKFKHYPYFDNYQRDLVQPHSLQEFIRRVSYTHYRYPVLEDLLLRLRKAGIEHIDTNTEFQKNIYPIIYPEVDNIDVHEQMLLEA